VHDGADDPWDNYQCKQFAEKLRPADIWIEIGKMVYWSWKGTYSPPRAYRFVSPLGASPTLRDLLRDPDQLRKKLKSNWTKKCASLAPLDGDLKKAIDAFDFSNYDVITGEEIIKDLKGKAIYPVIFGGGLTKPRPANQPPPDEIAEEEMPYVAALVDAYTDHAASPIATATEALVHGTYGPHLRSSRREFYCAESLKAFSKDVLVEEDGFGSLQEEIHDGIRHTVAKQHSSGYDRVLSACEQATRVEVSDHPLRSDLKPADRAGICHQLANDGRIERWTT